MENNVTRVEKTYKIVIPLKTFWVVTGVFFFGVGIVTNAITDIMRTKAEIKNSKKEEK